MLGSLQEHISEWRKQQLTFTLGAVIPPAPRFLSFLYELEFDIKWSYGVKSCCTGSCNSALVYWKHSCYPAKRGNLSVNVTNEPNV